MTPRQINEQLVFEDFLADPLMTSALAALMSPTEEADFNWWAINGNADMCAATLRHRFGFTQEDGMRVVQSIRQAEMVTTSPACAHFAIPMSQDAHA